MKELNKNNFLRWTGSFKLAPFSNIAANDSFEYAVNNMAAIIIDVLANDTSTYGVDPLSFEFVTQVNDAVPATWNSFTRTVTFYPAAKQTPGNYFFRYRWKDVLGNYSNIATVNLTVLPEAGIWLPVEFFCLVDSNGNHTGQQMISYFQLYAGNPVVPVVPNQFKPNIVGDPDYTPPYTETTECPIGTLPVALSFMLSVNDPAVDPAFRFVSYELRRVFDNGLVKSGTPNQANFTTTGTQCASGIFNLTLNFSNFSGDGVAKEIYVESSTSTPPGFVEYPSQPVAASVTIPNISVPNSASPYIVVSVRKP